MLIYSLCLVFLCVFCCKQYVYTAITPLNANLKEGSPCTVKNGTENVNGTCTSLFKCTSAAQVYINFKAGFETAWPPVYACSTKDNGEYNVCCLDCYLDETENLKGSALMEKGKVYSTNGSKAWLKCIEYYSTLPYRLRIPAKLNPPYWKATNSCIDYAIRAHEYGFGGYNAKPAEFPHMALLGYGADRESAQWLCGGSIISERFILSAAHCAIEPKLGNVSFAALGILKRTDLTDYWRIYTIQKIIIHPEYQAPSKYHDIMLLETSKIINFGKTVMPACLDADRSNIFSLSATGWGRLSARGEVGNHLQVMLLNEYNQTLCSKLFPPHRLFLEGYNHTIQMCYGRMDKVVDTCEGDSGGPLQSTIEEGYHHILGITSFGKDCGIAGNAGMYTRVRYYKPWIESIVWPDE